MIWDVTEILEGIWNGELSSGQTYFWDGLQFGMGLWIEENWKKIFTDGLNGLVRIAYGISIQTGIEDTAGKYVVRN